MSKIKIGLTYYSEKGKYVRVENMFNDEGSRYVVFQEENIDTNKAYPVKQQLMEYKDFKIKYGSDEFSSVPIF